MIKQFLAFSVIVFSFIGIFRSISVQAFVVSNYLCYSLISIGIIKLLSFYILKSFRFYLRGNLREVIIIGNGTSVLELKNLFLKKKELGYRVKAVFNNSGEKNVTGTINDSFKFLKKNHNKKSKNQV